MSKDYELIVAELKQICDNHGVYLAASCISESILGEILILPKGYSGDWINTDKQDDEVYEEADHATVDRIGSSELIGDRERVPTVTTSNIDYSKGGVIKGDKPYIVGESDPQLKRFKTPFGYIFDIKEGDTPITEVKGDFYAADDSDDDSGISIEFRDDMSKKEFDAQFMCDFTGGDSDE